MVSTANRSHWSLPEGFSARAGTLDDAEALVELLNDYWEPLLGMRKVSIEEAEMLFAMPGFDVGASVCMVQSPDGRLAGSIVVQDVGSPPVHPDVLGCVHPDFEGRGIGTALLNWAEERSRQAIARVPDGARVSMHLMTSQLHEPTVRLFEKLDLKAIRYALFMVAQLDADPPKPQWPDNINLCTYRDRPDLYSVFHAIDDAFRDHWGHVERAEAESFERFQYRIENDKDFDPTLWFLAMDGDEIAGLAGCAPKIGDDETMGFVNILGVRRSWRRRGIGLALLHHSFGEFRRRGKKAVGLGVDADSLTGATRLYEKAGMRVTQQIVTYEKELRPGEELATQSFED